MLPVKFSLFISGNNLYLKLLKNETQGFCPLKSQLLDLTLTDTRKINETLQISMSRCHTLKYEAQKALKSVK